MKVEYLIIIDAKKSFCRDKKSFKNFLQSDADLSVDENKIDFQGFSVPFELQDGEDQEGNNRFFHLKLRGNRQKVDEFQELLKAVRRMLHFASDNSVQVLMDDVSLFYSEKAYPIIHEIENLMRKLITKFMLTNVGLAWTKDTIPEDLKNTSRSDKISNNYLYETDFIQLANFLFDNYRTEDLKNLSEKLEDVESGNCDVSELKDFIPRSNWERYFRTYVDCEASYLKTRWEKLYLYRCKIAHNNVFTKDDFNKTEVLVSDVKPKIEEAINNLDKILVPEEERDELAEVVASNSSALYGEFILLWRNLESTLYKMAEDSNLPSRYNDGRKLRLPMMEIQRALAESEVIDKPLYHEIRHASKIRNMIVHKPDHMFSDGEMAAHVNNLKRLLVHLLNRFEQS